jgi:hypothetical protein
MARGQRETNRHQMTPTWGVVMTVNEPQTLILSNVKWHLATGASEVRVYLDDPDDPVAASLTCIDGCHVTACDAAYWARHRGKTGRPDSQMRRQTINANMAKRQSRADWLFHIDADEFIWQDSPLAGELAHVTAPQTEVNLPVLERLFPDQRPQAHLFDGVFRATADLDVADAQSAYAPFATFMKRGQYSHGAGKGGVRVDDPLRLGVHNATVQQGDTWLRSARHVSTAARLLHFDGVTPLHWLIKVLRYRQTPWEVQKAILQPHRAGQIEWMIDQSTDLDAARAAHAQMFDATPQRCAQLGAFDLLHNVPFDPRSVLGNDAPDLSVSAFDADLLARNEWFRDLMPT